MDNKALAVIVAVTLFGALMVTIVIARDAGLDVDRLALFADLGGSTNVAHSY